MMERDRFDHKVDLTVDRKGDDFQRFEVVTGVGRRRKWPDDFKARVVLESLEPGVVISEVARRHGLRPQQLFTWRNQMRSTRGTTKASMPAAQAEPFQFAAVVAEPAASGPASQEPSQPPRDQHPQFAGDVIEIVFQHAMVRVRGSVDTKMLTTVLRSLKATL